MVLYIIMKMIKRNSGNGRDQRNRISSPTDLSILADEKPSASGRVFAITEDHATKTSGTIT
nr:hypothetical protein [Tanacetum cinerariifolium]